MKRLALIILATLITSLSLNALPVGQERAVKVAKQFLANKGITADNVKVINNDRYDMMHIVVTNNAFVIVAADDAAHPILGYSLTATIAERDICTSMQWWLDQYNQEIATARAIAATASKTIAQEWDMLENSTQRRSPKSEVAVGPLLVTIWNQAPLYNDDCPYDEGAQEHAVTGCLATAMAQIMNYWQYPANGVGSNSYTHNYYGTLSADFSTANYDWGNMPPALTATSTIEQRSAVAQLMWHCGVSVNMNYNTSAGGGSSATIEDGFDALKNNFTYDPGLSMYIRSQVIAQYGEGMWVSKLTSELNNGRPILYVGGSSEGYHAFVFDGYDNDYKFHVNWGWGGAGDGYYAIGALNPSILGIGSGDGHYNDGNRIICNIKPLNGFRLPVQQVEVGVNGDSKSVFVFTSPSADEWTASTDADWIIITTPSGEGSGHKGIISFIADTNTSGSYRSATIQVQQGTQHASITINQYSCGVITEFPYHESFEGLTTACWDIITVDGHQDSSFAISNDINYVSDGGHSLQFTYSTQEPLRKQMLISPELLLPQNMRLTFDHIRQWSYNEHFSILYSTTDNNPESFIYYIGNGMMYNAGWKTYEGIVPQEARYIAILYDNMNDIEGRVWSIDNITLTPIDTLWSPIQALPYQQGWDQGSPEGWTMHTRNVENSVFQGIVKSSQAHSSANVMRMVGNKRARNYNQYLISPRIDAIGADSIEFYYRRYGNGTELMRVLYSTAGSTIDQFEVLTDTINGSSDTWQRYAEALPAGTRYVAINYCPQEGKNFYIDDFRLIGTSQPETAIRNTTANKMHTSVHGRSINITTPLPEQIMLYDASGRLLHSSAPTMHTNITVPAAGVYMLHTLSGTACRVVVL